VPETRGLQRRGFADAPLQTHIDGLGSSAGVARQQLAHAHLQAAIRRPLLDVGDLAGGRVGTVAFLGLGLVFMSALLTPGTYPVDQDVAAGFLCLAVAPSSCL